MIKYIFVGMRIRMIQRENMTIFVYFIFEND